MGSAIKSAEGTLGRVVVLRLSPGKDLIQSILEQARASGFRSALILGGAAALKGATLRNVKSFPDQFPITDDNRMYTRLEGPLELLSISGNISTRLDGTLHIHAHVAVSLGNASAFGGHLVEGAIVLSTAEIAIAEVAGVDLKRVHDEETKTLELRPEPLI